MNLILDIFYTIPVVTTERVIMCEQSASEFIHFQEYMFLHSLKTKVDSTPKQKLHLVLTWIIYIKI